jgi:hypothetical protein
VSDLPRLFFRLRSIEDVFIGSMFELMSRKQGTGGFSIAHRPVGSLFFVDDCGCLTRKQRASLRFFQHLQTRPCDIQHFATFECHWQQCHAPARPPRFGSEGPPFVARTEKEFEHRVSRDGAVRLRWVRIVRDGAVNARDLKSSLTSSSPISNSS